MSQNPIFIFNKIIAAKYTVMQCIAMSKGTREWKFYENWFCPRKWLLCRLAGQLLKSIGRSTTPLLTRFSSLMLSNFIPSR